MGKFNTSTPLLSIVIPTRNRIQYAISAICSILEISDSRLQLVVQDNSDSNDLEFWIKANVRDLRLTYNYSKCQLSFVDNFNLAVGLAKGEYLCLIGDDDGVNPEIIEATEFIKQENIDCMSVKTIANYVWPNAGIPTTLFTKVTDGNLSISYFNGSIVDANMDNELDAFIRDGGVNYLNFNLPKLYHGIVRHECLEAIKIKTGAYFGGLSPDIFISISLACIVKRVVITDYPLTLPGVCAVSASVLEGLLKKNSKKLKDAPHFRNRGYYKWSELVPRIYCVETIWADSSIAAIQAMGREDLLQKLDLPKLAAYCINSNRGVFRPVIRTLYSGLLSMHKFKVAGTIQFIWYLLLLKVNATTMLICRVWNRILMIIGMKNVIRINGLKNIIEASNALTYYLKENGFNFTRNVQQRIKT